MCKECARLKHGDVWMENETCFAFRLVDPKGFDDVLILPKRHTSSFFQMTYKEKEDALILLNNAKSLMDARTPGSPGHWFHCFSANNETEDQHVRLLLGGGRLTEEESASE